MAKPTPTPGVGPGTRIREAVDSVVAVRLADVRRHETALGRKIDQDTVHDMRVASRRLRAALKLFKAPDASNDAVKDLQDALGRVRDIHVQLHWIDKVARQSARGTEKVVLLRVRSRVATRLPKREMALQRALRRWRDETAPTLLRDVAADAPRSRFGGGRVRRVVGRRLKNVGRALDRFVASEAPKVAHQLRIEVKKLRYLVELLREVWPHESETVLDGLSELQGLLGDLHDADVRIGVVRAAIRGGNLRGREQVINRMRQERAALAEQARNQMEEWQKQRRVKQLRELIAMAGR